MKHDFFTLDIPIPNTKDGKFIIPDSVDRVMFDIGASYHAPNAHRNINDNTFVIVVEPDPRMWISYMSMWYHTQSLPKGKNPMHLDDAIAPDYFKNFVFLPCAVGIGSKYMKYNLSNRDGKSSLLEPNEEYVHHQPVMGSVPVRVLSLASLIDMVPDNRNIDLIKVDCQGYDEQVVLSADDRLNRVSYLGLEIGEHESKQYKNSYSVTSFKNTLNKLGFSYVAQQGGQTIYSNDNNISKYTFNIG